MKNLKRLYFEVYTDGSHQMCVIKADIEDYEKNKDHKGLYHIWFVLRRDEFVEFSKGGGIFVDGTHKLESFGDLATFYDMDFPRADSGVTSVKYYRMNFPLFVRRLLLRMFKRVWALGDRLPNGERVTFEISQKRREKWESLYGVGKGNVELDIRNNAKSFFDTCIIGGAPIDRARDIIEKRRKEGQLSEDYEELMKLSKRATFEERIDYLKAIASNGTGAFFQTGRVCLYKDLDGFNFAIVNPKGNETMYGGVVNHGKETPDWSIHT